MKLTNEQKRGLKEHVYRSQGCSLLEDLLLKHFWTWLVTKFPRWLAPNLITLIGFAVTVASTLSVLLQDMGCQGVVRSLPSRFIVASWQLNYALCQIIQLSLFAGSKVGVDVLCSGDYYVPNIGWL